LDLLNRVCRQLALSRRELGLLAAVFVLSLPAVTPRIYASDEVQYFSYLRSLWFDRDVSFENEYRHFLDRGVGGEGFEATFLQLQTEAGRRPNFGTIGSALLWAPFYAAGDLAARLMRWTGSAVEADGYSMPYVAAVAYGSAFYGFVAVLLSIAAVRRYARVRGAGNGGVLEPYALAAGLLVLVGTPLLFYSYVAPPYAHACSAFAVALFVTVWLHVRASWTAPGIVALGLAAALMAMVREQDVFLALGPAIDYLAAARRVPLAVAAGHAAAGVVAFFAGLLPQLAAYNALNGHPGPSTLVTRKMSWQSPHALQVLASPSHGYIFWTPLAILAIGGLVVLAVRAQGTARRLAACALVMIATQIYISGSVESWTVAGAFGQRRFVAISILLAIGLAGFLGSMTTRPVRAAAGTLVGLCVWWNLALMAQFGTNMMDRQRLELRRNAYTAFVTIPAMAPSLAWRYITDRRSFFADPDAGGHTQALPPDGVGLPR
jgi:hypothetical protein